MENTVRHWACRLSLHSYAVWAVNAVPSLAIIEGDEQVLCGQPRPSEVMMEMQRHGLHLSDKPSGEPLSEFGLAATDIDIRYFAPCYYHEEFEL